MLFRPFPVEHEDPAVVEVEGDDRPFVGYQPLPPLPVTPDALDNEQRPFVGLPEHLLDGALHRHPHQLRHTHKAPGDGGTATTGGEVVLVAVGDNRPRLSPIGQTEIEPPQPARQPVVALPHGVVGIVRPMLTDHIAHKGVVRGRLYAEATRVMQTAQPDEPILHPLPHGLLLARLVPIDDDTQDDEHHHRSNM